MKFFIYSRKSVFTEKGESVKNQIELCKKYIETKFGDSGKHQIEIFEDEGFSAKNIQRPAFQRMMKQIHAQAPDFIVCYRLDRISRNVGDFASLIEELNYRDISFICIKEEFDTSKPMGKAMMYIASVIAQLERETTAERVRDNMLLLAKAGYWLGGPPPTGYVSQEIHEVLVDGKTKRSHKLEINPSEIHIVKFMYDTMRKTHSMSRIGKELATKNIRSRNGKFFSLIGIKDILSNPVYCVADQDAFNYFTEKAACICFSDYDSGFGILPYNRRNYSKKGAPRRPINEWIIAVGKHPGLIPGTEWVEVQNIINNNRPAIAGSKKPHNDYSLLSGLILCKQCGERMFVKPHSQRKEIYYYICGNKASKGMHICNIQNLQGNDTDQLVTEFLLSHVNPNSGIFQFLEKLKNAFDFSTPMVTIEEIEDKIDKLKQELNNLVVALTKSSNMQLIEIANKRSDEISSQISSLEKEKENLTNKLGSQNEETLKLDIIATTLSALKNNFHELTIHEKQRVFRLLIQKIEWDGENLDIFIYGE